MSQRITNALVTAGFATAPAVILLTAFGVPTWAALTGAPAAGFLAGLLIHDRALER